MDFHDLFLRIGLRSRVLHRLPGRMRIEVTALTRLPHDHRDLARSLIKTMPLPRGVKSVEPSFITGNLLLEYDPRATSEAQILEFLDALVDLAVRYKEKLARLTAENAAHVCARLEELLSGSASVTKKRLKEALLCDDVWPKK